MSQGFPIQSIVFDSEGKYWVAREEALKSKQRFALVNDDGQGAKKNIDRYLDLDGLSRWVRPVETPSELSSEMAFEYLYGTKEGVAGTRKRVSVDLMTHQLRALAIFEGAAKRQGLLIADEVGTGKTYSAGHILHHGLFHGSVSRALVLCPAQLVDKWKDVLFHGFGIRCGKARNGIALKRWLEGDDNGFEVYVSSYDKGKATFTDNQGVEGKIIDELEINSDSLKNIDLIVFDEIHNLIGLMDDIIDRRRLADLVSSISLSRVGLTATPLWKSTNNLEEIARIIRPWATYNQDFARMLESQSVVINARNLLSKKNLNLVEWATCFKNLEAVITDSEIIDRCRVAEDISEYERGSLATDIASKGPFSTWITRTRLTEISDSLAKRVVPPADIVTLSDEPVGKLWDPVNETYVSGQSEREVVESIESLLSAGVHKLQLASSPTSFHRHLPKIIAKGGVTLGREQEATSLALYLSNSGLGSKEKRLVEVLEELRDAGRRGAVIFTRFRPTFDRLTSPSLNLEGRIDGLKLFSANYADDEDRDSQVSRFKNADDGFPVLVATRIMQEGVDLQASADCIIHYDLPKNPQELEQRIGRVDRIGQVSDVVEVRDIILDGLSNYNNLMGMAERIREFELNVGGMRPITPEGFLEGEIHGDVTEVMRKGIESWNLEIVSQLDLRAFNEEDLPEGLDRTGVPEFIRLASKPVEVSLRKLLPPSTSFDCEDMRNSPSIVNISPPIPYNIEAFVVSSQGYVDQVKKDMKRAYLKDSRSFAVRVEWPSLLPSNHSTKKAVLGITRATTSIDPSSIRIIGLDGLGFDTVRIFEISREQSGMKSSSIIAVGTLAGKSSEIAENVWKDIVVKCSREGVLCNDEEELDFFPPGDVTIEDRLQREHQSGVVWEKQRLNAEARRNFAISSRLSEDGRENDATKARDEGEKLQMLAEDLGYSPRIEVSQRLLFSVKELLSDV